jgi:oligopeptide transport system ATP-binding protein
VSHLLTVSDLRVEVPTRDGVTTLVNGIDFAVDAGEVLGVVGESGSGKTMSMLAVLGLLPAGVRATGNASFQGRDLLAAGGRAVRRVRGRHIAMVFQNPMTSLHPMLSIERQLTEHMRHHLGLSGRHARLRAVELLEQVRIPNPSRALASFPHQFSGGMRQRIAIATALACGPKLLVADEPTTALDTTVQAGILRLLDHLRRESGLAIVLITHDLGVVAAIADRVTVLYAGEVVEEGTTERIVRAPQHRYTQTLLAAIPKHDVDRKVVGAPADVNRGSHGSPA